MLKKLLIGFIGFFFLAGCVKIPEVPKYTIETGDKIGYLIDVDTYPTHTHIGTTIFNNFTKKYKYNWKMKQYITSHMQNRLSSRKKLQFINLSKYHITSKDLNELIVNENEKWIINPKKENIYQKLRNLGIKAIVHIKEDAKLALLECGAFGCTEHYAKGYGLFTRSMLGMDNFYAATSFHTSVLLLHPIGNLQKEFTEPYGQPMAIIRSPFGLTEAAKKSGFILPKDFKNITNTEMKPIEIIVKQYIDNVIKKIATVFAK